MFQQVLFLENEYISIHWQRFIAHTGTVIFNVHTFMSLKVQYTSYEKRANVSCTTQYRGIGMWPDVIRQIEIIFRIVYRRN